MNYKILKLIIYWLSFAHYATAQKITPEKLGFKPFVIADKALGNVNYYITSKSFDSSKPILLYLDGSGSFPLFQKMQNGVGSSVVIDTRKLSKEYHIILISKPGIPFFDSVGTDEQTAMPTYKMPDEYKQKLSLQWRVNACKIVLKDVKKKISIFNNEINVIGISEGFQVAAKLASEEKAITNLALLVGNGLNQFYDFIIHTRIDEQKGKITNQQAQTTIDSLLQVAKKIYENPTATDKEWYGHTYLRWASFTQNNPTENIMSLKIPVLIIAASNDINSAVLGTDYMFLESIRQRKTNITYKVYPYDHSFNEYVFNADGKMISSKNNMDMVLDFAMDWFKPPKLINH